MFSEYRDLKVIEHEENDEAYEKAIQNSMKDQDEGGFRNRMDQEPENNFQRMTAKGQSLEICACAQIDRCNCKICL